MAYIIGRVVKNSIHHYSKLESLKQGIQITYSENVSSRSVDTILRNRWAQNSNARPGRTTGTNGNVFLNKKNLADERKGLAMLNLTRTWRAGNVLGHSIASGDLASLAPNSTHLAGAGAKRALRNCLDRNKNYSAWVWVGNTRQAGSRNSEVFSKYLNSELVLFLSWV